MPYADPEAKRAHNREYRQRRKDELNAYKRDWFKNRYATDAEFREKILAANKATPTKVKRAAHKVWYAIKTGKLVRPDACSRCGKECRPEAAHHDYAKPLDVIWLCRSCHRKWDRESPKA